MNTSKSKESGTKSDSSKSSSSGSSSSSSSSSDESSISISSECDELPAAASDHEMGEAQAQVQNPEDSKPDEHLGQELGCQKKSAHLDYMALAIQAENEEVWNCISY